MTDVGDSISAGLGMWSFSEGVEENFDTHVKKSVPGYDLSHKIVCLLSDPFIRKSSIVLDIGCSTGTLLRKLYDRHKDKKPKLIGIDSQKNMIDHARKLDSSESIEYTQSNIITDDITEAIDMSICFYVLQFIPPSVRQDVVNKIYNSLNWGGAFFMYEKVRAPDARFQDYINHAFSNYKLESFTPDELVGKSNSLIGVMEPFSTNGNIELLERAGFKDICTISKMLCFEGFLAIK